MIDIWQAASWGKLSDVERLVGHDPSLLDAKDDRYGRTPLIKTSENSQVGVVRWLLDRGAAFDALDAYGCSALFTASCHGHHGVAAALVALLLERGADPTIATTSRMTPLMIASHYGRPETVRCLLAHPSAAATINRRDRWGCMALRRACYRGHGRVVRLLLKHGADPTIADNDGITPTAAARESTAEGRRECVEALEVRGSLRALGLPWGHLDLLVTPRDDGGGDDNDDDGGDDDVLLNQIQ
jgi:uncharacterized protein